MEARAVTPRVSVVVPTRNRQRQLARALASVQSQRFRDFEVLVVDDGSTDESVPWLRATCPEVRVLAMESPRGAAAARNRALEHARGDLVAFLDDDDLWRPTYLEGQVRLLDASPAADLSYADHVEIDPAGHVSRPDTRPLLAYPSALAWLLAECFIHTLSVVVCRRQVFERVGRFDESLTIVHDLDWYRRVIASGASVVHLPGEHVERAVPGGLVTSHRTWAREELVVLMRAFADDAEDGGAERIVRATRSLFFARVGLAKGDLVFGLRQLAEAFRRAPGWSVRIAGLRILRRCVVR
jgi:glycosyltransferase involved in cell wall biosynthesis